MAVSEPLSLPSSILGLTCSFPLQTHPSKVLGNEQNSLDKKNAETSASLTTYSGISSGVLRKSLTNRLSENISKLAEKMDEKHVSSWLSKQHDPNFPSKSYEDIYDQVNNPEGEITTRSSESNPSSAAQKYDQDIATTTHKKESSTCIDGTDLKCADSYSDLSAFSVRSSIQSSGFDSGQSTITDSRFSPNNEGYSMTMGVLSAKTVQSSDVYHSSNGMMISSSNSKSFVEDKPAVDVGPHPGGVTDDYSRPLGLKEETKVLGQEIKQIQKRAVLSYLRQRQDAASAVGTRPAQFCYEPPETAEKPTPIKPIAVALLDNSLVPPELPPKMFKSFELLRGANQESIEVEYFRERKRAPPPPPKTFKVTQQLEQAYLSNSPMPPTLREKSEKQLQRKATDSSLVMAKMVFLPAEDVPELECSVKKKTWKPSLIDDVTLPGCLSEKPIVLPHSPSENRFRALKNEYLGIRKRIDDGYGTCLDDEDDTVLGIKPERTKIVSTKPTKDPAKALLKISKDEDGVMEEIRINNLFEVELIKKLTELDRTNELRKFASYISNVDDIAALVVNLSLRIGKTISALNEKCEVPAAHKARLLQKIERMEQDLEEARRLESSCEKRWVSFGVHLSTFLGSSVLIEKYMHFMKNRGDLLVKQRAIHDKDQQQLKNIQPSTK